MQPEVNIVKSKYLESLLRLSLFVVTFILASLSVFGVDSFSVYIFVFIFPAGLIVGLTQDFNNYSTWSNIFGWVIYVSISMFAVRAKNRRVFAIIYIVFVILLITNVAGCNLIRQNINVGF